MADAYATPQDVYRQGIPRGMLVLPARPVASVDTTANTIELEGHGCLEDDPIQFEAEAGGDLPAGIPTGLCYAEPVDGSTSLLKVRATQGGSAVDITTEGSNFVMLLPGESERMLNAALESSAREIDGELVGHTVPLQPPYPAWVVTANAQLAGADVVQMLGRSHPIVDLAKDKRERLAVLARGLPLRDATATPQVPFARGVSPTSGRFGSRDPKVIS